MTFKRCVVKMVGSAFQVQAIHSSYKIFEHVKLAEYFSVIEDVRKWIFEYITPKIGTTENHLNYVSFENNVIQNLFKHYKSDVEIEDPLSSQYKIIEKAFPENTLFQKKCCQKQ